jgi:hypothetical protein
MIYSIISLTLLIIPFAYDFGLTKSQGEVQRVEIKYLTPFSLTLRLHIDNKNSDFKIYKDGKSNLKRTGTAKNPIHQRRR